MVHPYDRVSMPLVSSYDRRMLIDSLDSLDNLTYSSVACSVRLRASEWALCAAPERNTTGTCSSAAVCACHKYSDRSWPFSVIRLNLLVFVCESGLLGCAAGAWYPTITTASNELSSS